MSEILAISNNGVFTLDGHSPEFDPTSVISWQNEIKALIPQASAGNSGTIGEFQVSGPSTLVFIVSPVGAGLTAAPGTLFVYTEDTQGQPTIQSFPVNASRGVPNAFPITFQGGSNQQSQGPGFGAVYFTIVPTTPALQATGFLEAVAELLKQIGHPTHGPPLSGMPRRAVAKRRARPYQSHTANHRRSSAGRDGKAGAAGRRDG